MNDFLNTPVVAVSIRCNPLVVELMGRPTAATGLEARFCALHGVAVGLAFGEAGIAQFSDEIARDPVIEDLRRRSRLEPTESCPREAASVVVTFEDGTTVENEVLVASEQQGESPMTDAQLINKVRAAHRSHVLPGRSERGSSARRCSASVRRARSHRHRGRGWLAMSSRR